MLPSTPEFFVFLGLIFFGYWLLWRFRIAGIALIIDVIQNAAKHNTALQLQLAPRSLAARILALTGLEPIVPMVPEPTQSTVSGSSFVNPG